MLGRLRPYAKDAVLLAIAKAPFEAKAPRAVSLSRDGREELARDPDELTAVASTLKAMTAYAVRPTITDDLLDESVTVTETSVEGAGVLGLMVGDQVTYRDLLYGMLLPSDNDSAHTLGVAVGRRLLGTGSGDPFARFLQEMQALATERGWDGAHFADTSGNDNSTRMSTRQLAELMLSIADDATLVSIMGTQERQMRVGRDGGTATLVARHSLDPTRIVKMPEFVAGKTGGTAVAGSCMVWLWEAGGEVHASAFTGAANAATRSVAMRQMMDEVASSSR